MPSVAVLAADGFETIECLTMVDVMRRGGVRATLVSIMPTREVVSSLQIPVTCDALFDEINFDEYDCVVLPGGLPGATNLRADQRVCDVVCEFAATKHVAAICAAPATVLVPHQLFPIGNMTGFPALKEHIPAEQWQDKRVVWDPRVNLLTSQAPGTSIDFALKMIDLLVGREKAYEVASQLVMAAGIYNYYEA